MPPSLRPLLIGMSLACGLAWLGGCARPPPEQALREAIAELQAAVEARESAIFEERLAEDFIGPHGLDREGARRTAQALYLRHREVGITLGPIDVVLQEGHATVRFDAVLTGSSGAGLLPDSGQVYEVTTGWRLEDGEWRMTSAQWEPRL